MARLLDILAIVLVCIAYTSNVVHGRTFGVRNNEKQLDPEIVEDVADVLLSDPNNEVHALEQAVDACFKNGDATHQKQLVVFSLAALRQLVAKLPQTQKRKRYVNENSGDDEEYFYRRDVQEIKTILKEVPKFLNLLTDDERVEFTMLYEKLLAASQSDRDTFTKIVTAFGNKCAKNESFTKRSKLYQHFNYEK